MHIGLFNRLFLNGNGRLGFLFGIWVIWCLGMELWISSLFGLNMIGMNFLVGFDSHLVQGGRMDEKRGKTPISVTARTRPKRSGCRTFERYT